MHLNALQSTGFDKNELHCPLGRCSGLPGKQFLRSSESGTPKHAGGSPVKKLFENVKFWSLGKSQILSGIFPERKLLATLSCSKLTSPPNVSGNGPTNLLELTSNTVKFFNDPIPGGKQELSPLFIKIISFSLVILPKLAGKHPWNLLLARTMTDTGEFPKLSGSSNLNLLWLIKIASKSLSNSSLGTPPSNSLNLRSKNLSVGSLRTTSGNLPANRLLLRSNS